MHIMMYPFLKKPYNADTLAYPKCMFREVLVWEKTRLSSVIKSASFMAMEGLHYY